MAQLGNTIVNGALRVIGDAFLNISNLGFGCATCDTAAATAAKTATLSGFKLNTGGIVTVKFTNAVPANATLNINSTGAKAIYSEGAAVTADAIEAGQVVMLVYDGSKYVMLGGGGNYPAAEGASF